MQAIRSNDTTIEIALAKALWARGHHYRKNDKTVFGKPDLTFKKCRIAIFVDSEYFHGKDSEKQKHRINTNRSFWWAKIEGNIQRDKVVNKQLTQNGWKVLRFWGKEVQKKLPNCIRKIERTIEQRKNGKLFSSKK